MVIIYVLGTDGAGKTTVTKRLAEQSQPGRKFTYLYGQHIPRLLWILKLPARLLFMRKTDQFKSYDNYKARKDEVSRKSPWLTKIYAMIWYLDVLLQTWPKLLWARLKGNVILMDRYYLDWIVNLGVLQRNSTDNMLRNARFLELFLPRPQICIFLDVSEETAFKRKNDIQSVSYLRERKERYLQLAPHYHFKMVNANEDAETVFRQVKELVDSTIRPGASTEAQSAHS